MKASTLQWGTEFGDCQTNSYDQTLATAHNSPHSHITLYLTGLFIDVVVLQIYCAIYVSYGKEISKTVRQ